MGSALLATLLPISTTTAQLLIPDSAVSASNPPSPPPPPPPPPPTTLKVLVCGDSISQGAEGDFTWRYRLWQWFQTQQQQHTTTTTPSLLYVGPYNGTLPALVGANIDLSAPQTWGAYHATVDPAFSPGGGSAHFAVYGRPAWLDVDELAAHVAAYAPHVVVLHLGFNDVGWWGQTAAELVGTMQRLVANARAGAAAAAQQGGNVVVLIADVSHRLLVPGRDDIPRTTDEYNRLLAENVALWDEEESPVVMVPVSEEYDCHVDSCPAGIDGLHPNALGDFQIARAYSKILHERFHYGAAPLVVPPTHEIPGMSGGGGRLSWGRPFDEWRQQPALVDMSTTTLFALVLIVGVVVAVCARRPRCWLRGKGMYRVLPTSVRD